jgi:hypothetical protein
VSETNKPDADEPKPTYTPGPWIVSRWHDESSVVPKNGGAFAPVLAHIFHRDDGSNENDATLIAAAPDMLAVLKELEESACYWSEYDVPLGIVDRIKAAIAKAEGR